MRGCEWQKKSFSIRMPSEAKNPNFSRSCETCKNNKTKLCDTCQHWKYYKRAKL